MISVIIPAYNLEQYLAICLDSLLKQTYQELELIVVDDGSTDGTGEIADRYAETDSRIRVVHKENGGVSSARIAGLRAASGEWIGFVDGDDYVEPWMFERLYTNALQEKADISHCGYLMEFPDHADPYYGTGHKMTLNTRESLLELLSGRCIEPGLCNKLFRKSLVYSVLQQDLIDQSIRINEDLLMNFYLFREAEKSVFEDVCPYHYVVHRGSAANSKLTIYKLQDPEKVRLTLLREMETDPEMHAMCLESLTRHYIRSAILKQKDYLHESDIGSYIRHARVALRRLLPTLFHDSFFDTKLKFQALWAGNFPASYRFVHEVYGEITGARHKYDIHD